jgi:hypothetical protein
MTRLVSYLRAVLCRKHTTWSHLIAGALVALLLASDLWLLGLVLFCGFAWYEYWECLRTNDSGHIDYWEMLLGMFITAAVLLVV